MAAPTLTTPFQTSYFTGSSNAVTLTPPGIGQVGFYVVGIDLPNNTVPTAAPAFQRPRDTYDQRWPTITNWEVASFVLAVRGTVDLPALTWLFPTNYGSLTVAWAFIEDCSFQLRASNILDAADDQLSPAAQPGCFYSLRGGIGSGTTVSAPPVPQVAFVAETATVPAQAVDPSPSGRAAFSALYATVSIAGPPTIGNDAETFDVSTWSTNSVFFPDVWGSTLSIYAPGDNPGLTYGWHTGRIGWG